ncbi:MAG: META domain-containing protein [Acidimicrobiia bacterium]
MNRNLRSRGIVALAVGVLSALALTGCGSGTDDDPTGRTWELTELEGSSLVEGTTIDLTIADGTASGNAGCNTYTGEATVSDDGSMTVGPEIASTMMACEEPVMDQEQRYLDALAQVTGYEMAPDELLLLDANGIALLTFSG